MMIYEHKTSITASAGSVSTITLKVYGGLLRYAYVQANTSTTVFRANLTDEDGDSIIDWGFHIGSLRDSDIAIPLLGKHTLQITNASPNDIFKVKLRIAE